MVVEPLQIPDRQVFPVSAHQFNADDPSGSDGSPSSRRARRQISRSFDSDTMGKDEGTAPVRQPLLRAIRHELLLLAAEADGVSDKVKRIINTQRQRLDGLIEETSKAPRRLQSKIAAPLDKRRREFHGKIRKAVTGDPMKSVRLHLEEKRSKPFALRMLDKTAFTVGVLTMIVSEYVLLLRPERFWLWYSVMIPVLLLMRYPDYRQRKWLFFYLDFCYYVQVCCMVAIFVLPHNCRLHKIIFMFTMGSLLWAVPLWRNSLVFHDVDKMTSCFIHLFPSWLAITLRWCPLDPLRGGEPGGEPECQEGINAEDMGMALFLYLLWQVLYYVKTEHADKPKLDADPDIQTSLRWLTTSPNNTMHRIVLRVMRTLRIFKKDETFDPTAVKTKVIFMGSQLVYTLVVTLPTPFLYNQKWTSVAFAFFVFLCALWNSSNYYIEVFSRKYWQSVEAEATAKSEALLLKTEKARERELARHNGSREVLSKSQSERLPASSFSESEGQQETRLDHNHSFSEMSSSSVDDGAMWTDEVDLSGSPVEKDEKEEEEEEVSNGAEDSAREKSKDV